ncbi:MAG: restriction endonuclease, partial [Actinobacteria bacterium]|nr:restriction endonuclease [Actinomycetota bacterium]
RQKVYGLGYSLLVFVYDKSDDQLQRTGRLNILYTIFVENYRTGDFQTTSGLKGILDNNGNTDDILAFFEERMLPLDEIQAQALAEEVIQNPPEIGYLTISNALQWRLQYNRVIQKADEIPGINKVL